MLIFINNIISSVFYFFAFFPLGSITAKSIVFLRVCSTSKIIFNADYCAHLWPDNLQLDHKTFNTVTLRISSWTAVSLFLLWTKGEERLHKMTDIAIVTSFIISEKDIFACKKRLKS